MDNAGSSRPPEIDRLFDGDPYLKNHESDLLLRWNKMVKMESAITSSEGGLAEFARSYRQYGIVQKQNGDVEVSAKELHGHNIFPQNLETASDIMQMSCNFIRIIVCL